MEAGIEDVVFGNIRSDFLPASKFAEPESNSRMKRRAILRVQKTRALD
jgi:hypothetical protein